MDPVTIGVSIGTVLIAEFSKKLLEKATDPESVSKSINWIFSAVDHFLKVRKGQLPKDALHPPPPDSGPSVDREADEGAHQEEANETSVVETSSSKSQESRTPLAKGITLSDLDDFAMSQLASEIESVMEQLEIYMKNLRFEEEKAAQYGGRQFAPPIVMNTIRIQQEEIAKRVVRLNNKISMAYGASAPNLEVLAALSASGK